VILKWFQSPIIIIIIIIIIITFPGPEYRSRYSDGLDGPGIESRWGARFSAPVQTGPGAHSVSYTTGTESFLGVKKAGRFVDHTPHLAPRLKKE
jgi:hypothetical protein